jgi:hypothetical protein
MRAPVVRVTIGDYLYRVPGFLESVNITVDNNYPWEVNLEKSQLGDVAQLPQVLDIAISFKPIMDILPKRASIDSVKRTTEVVAATNNFGGSAQETTTVSTNIPALIANVKYGPSESEASFIDPGKTLSTSTRYITTERINPNPANPDFTRALNKVLKIGQFKPKLNLNRQNTFQPESLPSLNQ